MNWTIIQTRWKFLKKNCRFSQDYKQERFLAKNLWNSWNLNYQQTLNTFLPVKPQKPSLTKPYLVSSPSILFTFIQNKFIRIFLFNTQNFHLFSFSHISFCKEKLSFDGKIKMFVGGEKIKTELRQNWKLSCVSCTMRKNSLSSRDWKLVLNLFFWSKTKRKNNVHTESSHSTFSCEMKIDSNS